MFNYEQIDSNTLWLFPIRSVTQCFLKNPEVNSKELSNFWYSTNPNRNID